MGTASDNEKYILIFVIIMLVGIIVFMIMLYSHALLTAKPIANEDAKTENGSPLQAEPSGTDMNRPLPEQEPEMQESELKTRECGECPVGTDWSPCQNNRQVRKVFACSPDTNFACASNEEARECKEAISLDELKKTIVRIRYDASGCCDSNGSISEQLGGSGSGVILFRESGTTDFFIATSRHVVDCVFNETCLYPTQENIEVRTVQGDTFRPVSVSYAPGDLDLAILKVNAGQSGRISENKKILGIMHGEGGYKIGNDVIAIGYPGTSLGTVTPILEFSTAQGTIKGISELLTWRGTAFKAIQSDALTSHGSSGGGLFTSSGQLIGITTWGNTENQTTIAIDTKIIFDIIRSKKQDFTSCATGTFPIPNTSQCCEYGTIPGQDGKCYIPCGQPNSYCEPQAICWNNTCIKCPSGYSLNSQGKCEPNGEN